MLRANKLDSGMNAQILSGLNPCYSGCYARMLQSLYHNLMDFYVLILVIVDVTREFTRQIKEAGKVLES